MKKKRKAGKVLAACFFIGMALIVGAFFLLNARPLEEDDFKETNPDLEDIVTSDNKNVDYFLVCGLDLSESLTDIMMIVCFNHQENTASILQIPRDTYVGRDIPSAKMNAVYGSPREGESKIKALMRRVNVEFGLPIDHYVIITIEGFRNLVDAVDGVPIDMPSELRIKNQVDGSRQTIGPGEVLLDGELAESFVRHRQGYDMGDLDRVRAQRLFFAGFAKKMLNMSAGQMTKAATSAYDEIKTDLSVGQMLSFVRKASKLDMEDISIYGLPGQAVDSFTPEGFSQSLSYYSIHRQEYIELANKYFNPFGEEITEEMVDLREIFDTYYQSVFANDDASFESYADSE